MIVVLGAFDGFHRGHALLFERARSLAPVKGREEWGVVTFTPHPDSVVNGMRVKPLFSEEEQEFLVRFFAIPHVTKIHFNDELAAMSPKEFIALLESLLPVSGIVVGEDYRFGRGREGNADFLCEYSSHRGWAFERVKTLAEEGGKISSSGIKKLVSAGDVSGAKKLLGYPFFFRAQIVKGDGRGRTLGYPTANTEYPADKILPAKGVYAASVLLMNNWHPGALNTGSIPTFIDCQNHRRFETYILDIDETLYGSTITVFLEDFLRPEVKFDSKEELMQRIKYDVDSARACYIKARKKNSGLYKRIAAAF